MNFCVYKHTNKNNGKIYVGFTKDVNHRWKYEGKWYSLHNKKFWNDIQKYGWDQFTHEIIEDGLDEATARQREIYYIQKFRNEGKLLYNIHKGGCGGKVWKEHPKGFSGNTHTEKWCKAHSEFLRNPENNPMCNGTVKWDVTHPHPRGFSGHVRTEEEKEKIRQSMLKSNHPLYRKVKIIYPDGTTQEFRSINQVISKFHTSYKLILKIAESGVPYVIPKAASNKDRLKHLEGIKIIIG